MLSLKSSQKVSANKSVQSRKYSSHSRGGALGASGGCVARWVLLRQAEMVLRTG